MSIKSQMQNRAVAMAEAAAARARTPQELGTIRQQLVNQVQSGTMPSYVGIPLIQDLTQKMAQAQAKMAQQAAGMGTPPAPEGAPIAQQVMEQAQQTAGVTALPSNLPESYAGGGIIAFEDGGKVERFQNTGSTGTTPAGRFFSGLGQSFSEEQEAAKLRNQLQLRYGPASALPGLFMRQSDEERQIAKQIAQALPSMSFAQLQQLAAEGPAALTQSNAPATQAVAPTATPAANINQDLGPVPGTTGRDVLGGRPTSVAAPSAPPGGGGFKMPGLQAFTPTPAVLPERAAPVLADLNAIVSGMPDKTKAAAETAVRETQDKLEAMDKPGFEAREGRLGKREATQEKDSAIGRALNLMSLGFGIAGSKERTLAGALGNEGRQGIRDLIQGEAANRAARDRLEEYRDNLEQQKIAARKGNYQAAQTAGREASRDLTAATQLALTGAQAGNAQAISMYSALQQGDIGKATLANQGEQLRASAVDSANRNALGLAGLQLQKDQLAQTGAFQTKQLAAMDKRYAALDKQSQARMAQVRAKAFSDFNTSVAPQLNAQLTAEYGKNWRTGTDARSLQAQMLFKQQQNSYLLEALGQYDDRTSARDSSDL